MTKIIKISTWAVALMTIMLLDSSCNEDFQWPSSSDNTDTIKIVNKFIADNMEQYYLWYNDMPDKDYKKETDPFAYFKSLLYKDDKWSYITNDYENMEKSTLGKEKTFGYSIVFGKFNNVDAYFAVLQYVNPNTAADKAGLIRGDIIIGINGQDITDKNYMQLINNDQLTLNMGILSPQGISKGRSVTLISETSDIHPVLLRQVTVINSHKIGYIVYNKFAESYHDEIDEAFQYFSNEGISDLVIDLRYNQGGDLSAARRMCSSVAPLDVVNNKKILVNIEWNDKLQKYFKENNRTDELKVDFDPTVPTKLGLKRLFVLTGESTASASELTIMGLEPYIDVVVIGVNTVGKYVGSITLQPKVKKNGEWVINETIYLGLTTDHV